MSDALRMFGDARVMGLVLLVACGSVAPSGPETDASTASAEDTEQTGAGSSDTPPSSATEPDTGGDSGVSTDTGTEIETGTTETGTTETGMTETGTTETGTTDTALVPCDPTPGVPGEAVSLTMPWDGEDRRVRLHLPADWDCSPRPLLIGLHGYYGSGEGFETTTARMAGHLEAAGAIGVFPDGLQMSETGWDRFVTSFNDIDSHQDEGPDGPTCTLGAYDYGVFDNCGPEEAGRACEWGTSCADDEGFLREVIEVMKRDWGVDDDRIFLTGFSQGGQTAQSLGARMGDVLAALAPSHGFAANGYTAPPETRLSLFQMWGARDRTVDGDEEPSSDGMIYDGATETLELWAAAQGCADVATPYPTISDGEEDWSCVEHAGCATGATVVSCVWDGTHVWGRAGGTAFMNDALFEFLATAHR